MVGVTRLADACAHIGAEDYAETLYELVLLYAGRNVASGGAISAAGSTTRSLGVLASVLERWDDAEQHLRAAIEQYERMGAHPFIALAMHDYAAMLLARGEIADVARAIPPRTGRRARRVAGDADPARASQVGSREGAVTRRLSLPSAAFTSTTTISTSRSSTAIRYGERVGHGG